MSQRAMPQEQIEQRGHGQNPTGTPIGPNKWGLDVRTVLGYQSMGVDSVESFSTDTNEITATAHNAKQGDRIKFTSGDLNTEEFSVHSVTTNEIKLSEEPTVAPGAADTFLVLRPTSLQVSSGGGLNSDISFILDGVSQPVTEDTIDSNNNRPLPVKLSGFTGDVTVTANQLNVQTSHTGANPDSTQIGDGTEILLINAAGEATVSDSTLQADMDTIIPELQQDVIETAYISYASSNLPGSASSPLQLIASLVQDIKQVQIFDTAGVPCELMIGAAAAETRKLVFGPGTDQTVVCRIPAATRVSIRRLDSASALAVGDLTVNFIG